MKLKDIIDIDLLQKVQDSFAEATGLATITVDFRGNPMTEYSNFSPFCNKIRENKELYNNCLQCDAFGGLEAARRETFFMYRCHTGLVDAAVPIMVEGQLIGSVMIGQAKLAENDTNRLRYIINEASHWKEDQEILDILAQQPLISYEKITAAAKMMFHVINNMVGKDVIQYAQEQLRAKDQQLIEQMKVQADLEKSLFDHKLLLNPNFLFDVINTMYSTAILERASKTQEVIVTFSEMMKYVLTNYHDLVTIEDEIIYIQMYLKLQELRFADRITVSIDIPKELRSIKIPPNIIYSILDNAVIHGLEPKDGKGKVQIKGYILEHDFVCEVIDEGVGMSADKIASIWDEINRVEPDMEIKGIGLHQVNAQLTSHFGKGYQLEITQNHTGGTTVRFRLPS
jgi:ligand-binding sensor protein